MRVLLHDDNKWDSKSRPIINVKAGTDENDAVNLKQLKDVMDKMVIYDAVSKTFKCGNKTFELVEHIPNKPLVYYKAEAFRNKQYRVTLYDYKTGHPSMSWDMQENDFKNK